MNWAGVARCRIRLVRNAIHRRGGRAAPALAARHPLLSASLALALASLICIALAGLFGQLAAEGASAVETAGALALVLTAALIGLLVFDLHEAVSTLVADSDLELLRRAPVSSGSLFLLKLLDVFPRTSLLLAVLAIPAVAAFHAFYPLPLWAWAVLPLQLVALWATPLGAGAAVAILMLRHSPPRRAREVLGLLSTLTLFALWLANSFLLPRIAGSEGNPIESLRSTVAGAAAAYRFSPGTWAARAVAAAVTGALAESAKFTAWLVAGGGISLGAAAWVASRNLELVQSRITAEGVSRPSRRAPATWRSAGRGEPRVVDARRLPTATTPAMGARGKITGGKRRLVRAVLARDARLFIRDWTVLSDVVTAAILWTLLPLVGAPLYHPQTSVLARAMLVALTVGLGYEVAARALPFERGGWAWMKLAPVSVRAWILAKLAGAALLSLPLVGLAATSMAITLGLSALQIIAALCVVLPALALSLSVGLWTGAIFGHPDWTNPRAMLTPAGRIVATLLLVTQAAGWLALVGLEEAHLILPPGFSLWGPAVLAGLTAALPLRAAARHLRKREWRG